MPRHVTHRWRNTFPRNLITTKNVLLVLCGTALGFFSCSFQLDFDDSSRSNVQVNDGILKEKRDLSHTVPPDVVVVDKCQKYDDDIDPSKLVSNAQYKQDLYIQKTFFPRQSKGVFLESGAVDGIAFSNSLMFEKIGWTGILVEPTEQFEQLVTNRPNTINVKKALSASRGTADFKHAGHGAMVSGLDEFLSDSHKKRQKREVGADNVRTVKVETIPLHDLLNEVGVSHVDFFSLDTEGSEVAILNATRWDMVDIAVMMVETNYAADKKRLSDVMEATGRYVHDSKFRHGQDQIYVQKAWLDCHPEVRL